MQIGVPSLRRGRHVLELRVPPSDYGPLVAETGLDFCGDIEVRAVIDKIQLELLIRATIRAAIHLECARCLEEFDLPVEATFDALYVPRRAAEAESSLGHKLQTESQAVQYYDGMIDLGTQIIEAVQIAVPTKALCRPDCRGLCPRCGRSRNDGACTCSEANGGFQPFRELLKGVGGS
jgi:uncharacterized protein